MNGSELLRYGVTLAIVAGFCGVLLGVVEGVTKPRIDFIKDAELKDSLNVVLPRAKEFVARNTSEGSAYFEGLRGGELVGYAFTAYSEGYSSTIEVLVGVDPEGVVSGTKVLFQQETPGLGARIEQVRVGEDKPWFMKQFSGKGGGQLKLKRNGGQVDAITGASISSEAVSEGIYAGVSRMIEEINKK